MMTINTNTATSYWEGNGELQSEYDLLKRLIPAFGSVNKPHKNKSLERMRKVAKAYYRFFNDGDSNGRLLGVYREDLMHGMKPTWSVQSAEESFTNAIKAAFDEQVKFGNIEEK